MAIRGSSVGNIRSPAFSVRSARQFAAISFIQPSSVEMTDNCIAGIDAARVGVGAGGMTIPDVAAVDDESVVARLRRREGRGCLIVFGGLCTNDFHVRAASFLTSRDVSNCEM